MQPAKREPKTRKPNISEREEGGARKIECQERGAVVSLGAKKTMTGRAKIGG